MAEKSAKGPSPSQIRSTAMKHALGIEEKKKLRARVADLVLEAYDLPTSGESDPANASAADVSVFRECLSLFQPSDLDDLIQERNIDDRCGYALCSRPNRKVTGAGEKVWNQKGGKDFQIVSRAQMERWCSKACGNRIAFVRAQLSQEPCWLRATQNDVRLLDEVGQVDNLSGAIKALDKDNIDQEVVERLQALSLERGEETVQDVSDQVSIVEKANVEGRSVPPIRGDQSVEGHLPKQVRFLQQEN